MTGWDRLTVIALDGDDYAEILRTSAALGVVGGSINDAILAGCAFKAGVETIYTWNLHHNHQLGPEVVRRLRSPLSVNPLRRGADAGITPS